MKRYGKFWMKKNLRLWRKLFEKIISGLDEKKIATVIAFSLSGILLALYFFSG